MVALVTHHRALMDDDALRGGGGGQQGGPRGRNGDQFDLTLLFGGRSVEAATNKVAIAEPPAAITRAVEAAMPVIGSTEAVSARISVAAVPEAVSMTEAIAAGAVAVAAMIAAVIVTLRTGGRGAQHADSKRRRPAER